MITGIEVTEGYIWSLHHNYGEKVGIYFPTLIFVFWFEREIGGGLTKKL